jgi:hypothetical protein
MEMLWLAKQFWNLGERELYEYIRFFTMSAADFLEDYFEDDLIKAAMASPGSSARPSASTRPGSAYILLHHVMGDVDGNVGAWGLARGGMGAISQALAGALARNTAARSAPRPASIRSSFARRYNRRRRPGERRRALGRHRGVQPRCEAHLHAR